MSSAGSAEAVAVLTYRSEHHQDASSRAISLLILSSFFARRYKKPLLPEHLKKPKLKSAIVEPEEYVQFRGPWSIKYKRR